MLRVLVVDDSALARKLIGDHLASIADVEVVGRASNGEIALERIRTNRPDLLTLDLDMPGVGGLGVLRRLEHMPNPPRVLLVTGLSDSSPEQVREALELGAFDVVSKPRGTDGAERFRRTLTRMVAALAKSGTPRAGSAGPEPRPPGACPKRVSVVAIGVSTGGPAALAQLLPGLPSDLGVPVLLVQHIPGGFTRSLAEALDTKSALRVVEASDGEAVEPGKVYVAPGGRHLEVERRDGRVKVNLTDGPPENHCRPAADVLFRSVAKVYADGVLGVIMTGMGEDGARGLADVKRAGGHVLAQDEDSCTVYGMPAQAVHAGVVDQSVGLQQLAGTILRCTRGKR